MPPARSTLAISFHQMVAGWQLVTKSNASSANGSGGSYWAAATTAPRGCKSLMARAIFGGHDSVAAIVGGNLAAPARASPPPVWMSKAADAWANRALINRWYPHDGRCSTARPSSQEKSQPSIEADSASPPDPQKRAYNAVLAIAESPTLSEALSCCTHLGTTTRPECSLRQPNQDRRN
jgi:hypothetical protein